MLRLLAWATGAVLCSGPAFAADAIELPEPTSLALLATGVGAMLVYRLRGRK